MITSGNYEEGTGAKRALMLGAAVLVFTPMVLSLLLLLAVVSPKMDAVTQHMPKAVRSMVASGILAGFDYGRNKAKQDRAKRLDAETAAAYRPPFIPTRMTMKTPPEMEEMYRQQRETKKDAKELVQRAAALEKAGRECDAEELYTQAASKDTSSEVYEYTEGLGRAGLKCGDLAGARAGFEVAIGKEKKFIKGTDEDQLADVRQALLMDQQYLVVVYQKQHEPALAKQVCSDAHPGATSCTCKLVAAGVSCSYSPR